MPGVHGTVSSTKVKADTCPSFGDATCCAIQTQGAALECEGDPICMTTFAAAVAVNITAAGLAASTYAI